MKQSSRLIDYLIFTLLTLLLFFLAFERYLVLPDFLQVLGRTHPLLLHLPIGFLVILALLPLLRKKIQQENLSIFRSFLLDIAALSLALTAVAGLFLAQEEGYQSASVNWHKWSAVAVSLLTYGLLLWNRYFPNRTQVYYPVLYANLAILLVAGHLGGGITHGKDFLLAPVKADKALAITEDMPVYTAMIQPILDAKCVKCHSPSKSKGGLKLHDQNNLLAGGKNGPVLIAGNPDSSELIKRLYLPMEDEYHMPPEDQAQLTKAELQLLHEWVQAGADFQLKIATVAEGTPLSLAIQPIWIKLKSQQEAPTARYNFPPLKKATLIKLNTPFRTVLPTASGSPALAAKFLIAQSYKPAYLKELLEAKQQVTSINLSSMPLQDDALELLGQFPHLEKLFLNGTPITGETLEALVNCQNLQELALSNTTISKDQLAVLSELEQLKTLYIWSTSVTIDDLPELKRMLPGVQFELGYQADPTEILQLSPPRFLNKNTIIAEDETVKIDSKIPGTTIRYTMDGSQPDSLESPIYEQALSIDIDAWTTIKAKAFNPGWMSSDIAILNVAPAGQQADTIILRTSPNTKYKGLGASSLMDGTQGDIRNFQTNSWLGFRKEPMEVLFDFGEKPPTLNKVVGSFGKRMESEIFLPANVEIWGGNTPENLQILGKIKTAIPVDFEPIQTEGIEVAFDPSNYRYYLLKTQAREPMPKWHSGYRPGRSAWVFIDEVLFY